MMEGLADFDGVARAPLITRGTEPRRVYLDAACEVFCLVSPEDYEWATRWRWKWKFDRTKKKRYAQRNTSIKGRRVTRFMHKEILKRAFKIPPDPDHAIGDHQDGDSLNNQRDNLEWATISQNNKRRGRRRHGR